MTWRRTPSATLRDGEPCDDTGLFVTADRRKHRGKVSFGTYGVMLSRMLGQNPKLVAKAAARYRRLYEQHGLMGPVALLRSAIEALATGRRVGLGADAHTNASLSVGGAYRLHFNNGTFPVHFDSLHAKSLAQSSCAGQRDNIHWVSSFRGKEAERFTDLVRFKHQLAALICLQRSDRAGAEVTVFKVHMDAVLKSCDLPLSLTQHNVNFEAIDAEYMHNTLHHRPDQKSYAFNAMLMRRLRKEVGLDGRSMPLVLQPGDLYLFSANHVHMVHPTIGDRKRLSIGAFIGYSDDELRIWS